MKKIVCVALFCVAYIIPIKAQDAVHYGDSCYLFNPIEVSQCIADRFTNYNAYAGISDGFVAYEYILSKATSIYGIAVTMFRNIVDDVDSGGYTIYLYGADTEANINFIDSATSYSRATEFIYSAMNGNEQVDSKVPCYEYFFSHPHIINSTIYLTCRKDHTNYYYTNGLGICVAIDRTHGQHWIDPVDWSSIPPQYILGAEPQYVLGANDYWGGYFPIIQPERVDCTAPVAEVSVTEDGDAVLTWEMVSDSCQLSLTQSNMPVDSGLVVVLTDNGYTATGLAGGGTLYAARLRTQCHHHCPAHANSLVWSDWGRATYFRIGNQGVLGAEPVEWSLTPNPAHGSATVQCETGMTSVELMTVKGERIMLRDIAGQQTCTLDLAGLARGIYIVQVTMPKGTAARKLAVE